MIRIMLALGIAIGFATLLPARVSAQALGPRQMPITPSPTVSPYLNLLRSGTSPAINYYGLVRPQFDTIAGFQAVQQRFNQFTPGAIATESAPDDYLVTGHMSSFMNYSNYFMTTNVSPTLRTTMPNRSTLPPAPTRRWR